MKKLRYWAIGILAGKDVVFTNVNFSGKIIYIEKHALFINCHFHKTPDTKNWNLINMMQKK